MFDAKTSGKIFKGLRRDEEQIVLQIAAKSGAKFNIPEKFFKYETLLMRKNDDNIPIVPHAALLADAYAIFTRNKIDYLQ